MCKRGKPGRPSLLSGKMLTGRDAAHKRLADLIERGKPLPVDFQNRFIYYVGPVDPVRDEVIGPAGPTTATRMDKFTRPLLERTGLLGMIGKAERGPAAVEAIRDNGAVSLIAVGGAAYLIAKAITKSTRLAFEDLGMEAIYEFEVKDMPGDGVGRFTRRIGSRERTAPLGERNRRADRCDGSRGSVGVAPEGHSLIPPASAQA